MAADFKRGIEELNAVINPSLHLTEDGLRLVDQCIRRLDEKLVDECLKSVRPNSLIRLTNARNAVNEMFSGQILQLALAEGNKAVLKFSIDCLDYSPQDPSEAAKGTNEKADEKAKKEEPLRQTEVANLTAKFTTEVTNLTQLLFPETVWEANGEKVLCEMLAGIAEQISDIAKSSASENVTVQDIKSALDVVLPETLKTHAVAAGAKSVILLQTGKISLESGEEKISQTMKRKQSPKTKTSRKATASPVSRKRKRTSQVSTPRKRTQSPSRKKRKTPSKARTPRRKTFSPVSKKTKKARTTRNTSRNQLRKETHSEAIKSRRKTPSVGFRKRETPSEVRTTRFASPSSKRKRSEEARTPKRTPRNVISKISPKKTASLLKKTRTKPKTMLAKVKKKSDPVVQSLEKGMKDLYTRFGLRFQECLAI